MMVIPNPPGQVPQAGGPGVGKDSYHTHTHCCLLSDGKALHVAKLARSCESKTQDSEMAICSTEPPLDHMGGKK